MRSTLLFVAALLLLAVPVAADDAICPAVTADGTDAQLWARPTVELVADRGGSGAERTCSATADCGSHPDVSCTLSGSSGSCSFADRACPGERGHVVCGSITKHCPPCSPSVCQDGEKRLLVTPFCCSGQTHQQTYEEQICVDGQWLFNRWVCQDPCMMID